MLKNVGFANKQWNNTIKHQVLDYKFFADKVYPKKVERGFPKMRFPKYIYPKNGLV